MDAVRISAPGSLGGSQSKARLELERPFGGTFAGAAGPRETAGGVEPLRTLVVLVGPEVDPRTAAPPGLSENFVEDDPADPVTPALGNDVNQVEKPAVKEFARRGNQGHPDRRRPVDCDEEPGRRVS